MGSQDSSKIGMINKPINQRTLRFCFATHINATGYDLRKMQKLLGHKISKRS
jgi:site-specific recombinase XerD